MNETLRLISNRKSLRAYDPAPLSRKEIDTIINMSMRAPTAGNMMMYSILEVTDQKNKEKLVETCDHQPFIAKAPLVLIYLADMQRWYDYFAVSGVPDYCRDRQMEFEHPRESDLMLACCDALIAAQTAVIAAESMGIGSCYIGDIMEQYEIHKSMFNLPDLVFPITMLCFGKFKPSYLTQQPRPRFPQKFIHFQDQYQRIESDGFKEMYQHLEKGPEEGSYLKDAANFGQHNYLRKTGSDYSREMRRSVSLAIEHWLNAAL
jgi:FMN reductase (NADPH)